ncbi:MAG TPA: hypothetical protein VN041_13015 [Microbacterium sp.]|nr:hypothetical protein [Microbacterium sp.]HWU33109.1 hypothetical protein [Marmoricola sp.]
MDGQDFDRTVNAQASATSVRALVDVISRLTDDPEWLIAALTEIMRAMRAPVPPTEAEVEFLLSSAAFTPTQLSRIREEVARGSLTLAGAESFLAALHATWSLEQVARYVDKTTDDVLTAVKVGKLYAVAIAERLRFPVFQFNIGRPEPLIPHLPELIEAAGTQWSWISVVAFMETRQASLVAVAAQTPRAWLLDGGSFDEIKQIIDSAHWR